MGKAISNQILHPQISIQTYKTKKTLNLKNGHYRSSRRYHQSRSRSRLRCFCKDAVAACKAAEGCEWAKGCVDTEDKSKFAIFQKWTSDAARAAFAEKVKSEGKLANAVSTMIEAGSYKKRVFSPYQ